MMTRRSWLGLGVLGLGTAAASRWKSVLPAEAKEPKSVFEVAYSPDAWRKRLTPAQFDVLRESGTERPFTSPLLHEAREGTFLCAGCDEAAFASSTKFDSGTGWPSFWAPIEGGVGEEKDRSFGFTRTAIHCSRCGGHLGHVFNDGPKPTGLRYCMNGVALSFKPIAA